MECRMIPVRVQKGYNVVIGSGLLAESDMRMRPVLGACRLAIVTDSNIEKLYACSLAERLKAAGYDPCVFVFPAGEPSKNMDTLAAILEFFAKNQLTRRDCAVALGGGVTGDMTGFAAGCYLRGIRYVQIPTTLLAAVDSSVGGKTAVNLSSGKNLAGLFHQPSLVLCDTDCFQTLPAEEFANGAAEAVKAGILGDEALFARFETGEVHDRIGEIVGACVTLKAHVVEWDETEADLRKILNLGHTVGHAIEKCSGFSIPHGHAVAVGLHVIARAAERLGWAEEPIAGRIRTALIRNGLPVSTGFTPEELANAALLDKKRAGETITIIIPRRIGKCEMRDIPIGQLISVFRAGMEGLV
ncbi:MAG: 3-dehydroquinate synthase [Eubacteriales bacterium]|nr:3-dehydroquinate synthase [Eubacteriales bacterium]